MIFIFKNELINNYIWFLLNSYPYFNVYFLYGGKKLITLTKLLKNN